MEGLISTTLLVLRRPDPAPASFATFSARVSTAAERTGVSATHELMPDAVSAEPKAFSAEEIKGLEAMGYKVTAGQRTWGFMNAVDWNKKTGEMRGGTDPRGVSGSAQVK